MVSTQDTRLLLVQSHSFRSTTDTANGETFEPTRLHSLREITPAHPLQLTRFHSPLRTLAVQDIANAFAL